MLDAPGIALLNAIADASEGSLSAAVFFGSRSSRVATNAASAYDFLLVSSTPRAFYRAMHAKGLLGRAPGLLNWLDGWLAPTQIRLASGETIAKASVLSSEGLKRATSAARRDQFLAGRLFQDVKIVWAKDEAAEADIRGAVRSARRITFDWVAPDLPPSFDAAAYVRQLFATSFRFEIRPETRGRANALFEAQAGALVPAFEEVLKDLHESGELRRDSDTRFSLTSPVTAFARIRRRAFMEWSRIRATARWPKHAVTFDGWLDYIVRKAERHSGETIVLTPLERRLPFIFLWPRALGFLWRQRKGRRPV